MKTFTGYENFKGGKFLSLCKKRKRAQAHFKYELTKKKKSQLVAHRDYSSTANSRAKKLPRKYREICWNFSWNFKLLFIYLFIYRFLAEHLTIFCETLMAKHFLILQYTENSVKWHDKKKGVGTHRPSKHILQKSTPASILVLIYFPKFLLPTAISASTDISIHGGIQYLIQFNAEEENFIASFRNLGKQTKWKIILKWNLRK